MLVAIQTRNGRELKMSKGGSIQLNPAVARRRAIQWFLVPVVVVTIALGWKYPVLGFSVPVVMLTGFVGGLFNGRYVCGNLCPRGSFFDRIIAPVSFRKTIPAFVRQMPLRWTILAAMTVFMVWRIRKIPVIGGTGAKHSGACASSPQQ